jgi:hypothetical protein
MFLLKYPVRARKREEEEESIIKDIWFLGCLASG